MSQLEAQLQQHFGFQEFRPGQKALIQSVLDGHDTLGILPTGSGKSLCYQLPTLISNKPSLIVEPLIALMNDQVGRLQAAGEKRVIALSAQMPPVAFTQILKRLASYHYIFVSPEILQRADVLLALKRLTLGLFVVDEAHCISQWGPDFRPAYLQLGQVRQQLQADAILALTATAPEPVRRDIVQHLSMQSPAILAGSVDRPNIFLGVETGLTDKEKALRLDQLLHEVVGPTIIYSATRAACETLAIRLQKAGHAAAFYHAGLDRHQRDLIQRQFQSDQLQIICATSAFGMGIDKANVRFVVHTYVPESLEAYYQAIGRAGRDGRQSLAVLLVTDHDVQHGAILAGMLPDAALIRLIYAHPEAYRTFDDPQINLIEAYVDAGFSVEATQQQLQHRLTEKQASFAAMAAFVNESECRRAVLLQHFDSPIEPHTALCCGEITTTILRQLQPEVPQEQPKLASWQAVFHQIFR